MENLINNIKHHFNELNNNYVEIKADDLIYLNEDEECALKGGVFLH